MSATIEHPATRVTAVSALSPSVEAKVAQQEMRAAWWGVVARFLVHGLVVSTWVSRIPGVKTSLSLSDGALGVSLLGTAVGSITAIPVCGWIVNRYGSKRASTWTSIGFCIALILPALAADIATLFAALLAFGAMAGANDVAMNAQAIAVEKRMGTPTMSRFHAMFSVVGSSVPVRVASLPPTTFRRSRISRRAR